MYNIGQKALAEFVGTFTLIFIGAGAICADQFLKAANPGSPGAGLLGIAVAQGLAMAIMVTAVAHISGGHLNPAVTIGLWVTKRIGTFEGLVYWAAQLGGGAAAAYLLRFLIPEDVWHAPGIMLGTPALANGFSRVNGMVMEAALTFLLVWVAFATAVDEKGGFGRIAGFAIGLTVCMGILLAGPFTGGAMNPARAFGPALAAKYWTGHGVYWVGPLFGGALAGALYSGVFLKKHE